MLLTWEIIIYAQVYYNKRSLCSDVQLHWHTVTMRGKLSWVNIPIGLFVWRGIDLTVVRCILYFIRYFSSWRITTRLHSLSQTLVGVVVGAISACSAYYFEIHHLESLLSILPEFLRASPLWLRLCITSTGAVFLFRKEIRETVHRWKEEFKQYKEFQELKDAFLESTWSAVCRCSLSEWIIIHF